LVPLVPQDQQALLEVQAALQVVQAQPDQQALQVYPELLQVKEPQVPRVLQDLVPQGQPEFKAQQE
jgi:adenylate cyclase